MEPKSQEQQYDEKYKSSEYKKTVYDFSKEELRKIQSLDSIVQMGQIGKTMISQLVQGAINRAQVKSSEDVEVLYDMPRGLFIVYQPRIWCNLCDQRKAEYKRGDKIYCRNCIHLMEEKEKVEAKVAKKK